MADKEVKAAKEAAKAAEKEKKERIKRNKPKKDENAPNIFVRIWKAICKFFKDFKGTCKKVVWPDRQTILKSTGVVLVVVLIVGACIWIVDWALGGAVGLAKQGVESLGAKVEDVTDADAEEEGTTTPDYEIEETEEIETVSDTDELVEEESTAG